MPLLTTSQVAASIAAYINQEMYDLEVFTDFPSDEDVVSEGLYVARFYQADRNVVSATFSGPGSLYKLTDKLELYLILGQQNPAVENCLNMFGELIDDKIFEAYSPREYSVDQVYQNNSERYRITFSLTRHQLT